MKIITWDEYKILDSDQKLKMLRNVWNIEDNYLIGEIRRINRSEGYLFVKPYNLKYQPINYPYLYRQIEDIYGSLKGIDKVIELDETDDVLLYFEFELNNRSDKEKDRPIKINNKSIKVLGDYWKLVDDLGFEKENSILKNNIITDSLRDKLYFVKDLKNLKLSYKEELELEIRSLEERMRDTYHEIDSKEKLKKELEKGVEELKNELKTLETLGFPVLNLNNNESKDNRHSNCIDINSTDHIKYIRDYLKNQEGLFYREDIIARLYNGLKTNQIILLSGPPGTGKTSLVTGFAKSINAECKVISVKPNWTDNEDLLGFFNPMQNEYVSTPFLDILSEARIEEKNSKDKIYIICLDEMNLAHIEYYFSEFITKLELKTPKLELYSKNIFDKLHNEITSKIQQTKDEIGEEIDEYKILKWRDDNKIDDNEYQKYRSTWQSLKRYPAIFDIPQNVRFVGTLNMDETTKEISPKVLDRSFVIEITEQEEEKIENSLNILPINLTKKDINLKDEDNKLYKMVKIKLKELNDTYLSNIGVKISRRGLVRIKEYTIASEKAGINKLDKIIDDTLACKALPKINFYKDSENSKRYLAFKGFYNYISNNKNKYPITYEKLERMVELSEETNVITFWE